MSKPRFLLDTNFAIGMLQGLAPARAVIDESGALPEVSAVSQMTRMELLSFPSMTADDETKVQALLSAITVILIDDQVEQETIRLRRRTRLKLPDAIIGATSNVHGLTLLTLDEQLKAAMA